MKKLKVMVVSEQTFVKSMAGCGKNNMQLCGAKNCGFTPGTSR